MSAPTMDHALQRVAGELPEGWRMEINIERGSAWVDLYDAEGEKRTEDANPSPDLNTAEYMISLLNFAAGNASDPRAPR